jgi:hypothetical protein
MSETHVIKFARHAFRNAIMGANAEIDIAGASVPVTLLTKLPKGLEIPEEKLPAIYVYSAGEQLHRDGVAAVDRNLQIDVILLAKDVGDPMDQLDDLQLLVEERVIASDDLKQISTDRNLLGTTLSTDRGRVIFGIRTLNFGLVLNVTADDPSV